MRATIRDRSRGLTTQEVTILSWFPRNETIVAGCIFHYDDGTVGQAKLEDVVVHVKERVCWFKDNRDDPWTIGSFHQWGTENEEGVQVSVGIVETDDGMIHTPYPFHVCFKEPK
jgi:hypothetical protein